MNTAQPNPMDIDLDLDLTLYDGPLYNFSSLVVDYTYTDPETTYTASEDAVIPIIRRMTNEAIIKVAVQMEILRYVIQQEIGRRSLGHQVDSAVEKYFHVGRLANNTNIVSMATLTNPDDVDLDL